MDATDASFAKFMTTAVDLPSNGVSFWAPLTGGAVRELSPYAIRSAYSPGMFA